MADLKISQLTAATTPLAGTEVAPVVQSGTTKKVAVSDLTAGRAVSLGSAFINGGSANGANGLSVWFDTGTNTVNLRGFHAGVDWRPFKFNGSSYKFQITDVDTFELASDGNFKPLIAGKGVNFTANTPAAGMTSQLLNWYEEGTWTPNQGAGLTLVGAFSSAGTYTRIGRQVFICGSVSGATSVAAASAGAITTNLPYSAAADATGTAINAANNVSSILRVSSATLTAATAIAATTTITFSAVYSV